MHTLKDEKIGLKIFADFNFLLYSKDFFFKKMSLLKIDGLCTTLDSLCRFSPPHNSMFKSMFN